MTTVIIKSDSDKKTLLLMQLAEELGLEAEKQDKIELTAKSVATGIGRKATDEELITWLSKGLDETPLDIDAAFSKYSDS